MNEQRESSATVNEEQAAEQKSQVQPPVSPPATDGRMVYGLDGQEPVGEKEYFRREMPMQDEMGRYIENPAQRAIDNALQGSAQQQSQEQEPHDDAAYWKGKYEKLQEKHVSIAKYGNIINAMEQDSSLVDVMYRAISGEVVDMEDKDKKDDLFEDDSASDGKARPSSPPVSREQELAAAREHGARAAQVKMELESAVREYMEAGASEEEAEQFLKWAMNPSGVTAKDLLEMHRRHRGSKQQQAPQARPPKVMPPPPVAAASGGTDRPGINPGLSSDGGRHCPTDPNAL